MSQRNYFGLINQQNLITWPALRWAQDKFQDWQIMLFSELPDLKHIAKSNDCYLIYLDL